eukprot:9870004-Prorocentrum_lima.AAC.1
MEPVAADCDEICAMTRDVGVAIADGGATKPIMGVETWAAWLQKRAAHGLDKQVSYEPCRQRFRLGKQQVCTSTRT